MMTNKDPYYSESHSSALTLVLEEERDHHFKLMLWIQILFETNGVLSSSTNRRLSWDTKWTSLTEK